jgi:Rrf2 family iron-sulfur cluster assembly transcriptional regulator
MRLTSKGRYAVTAMLDIALHQHLGVVSLSDISVRQCISLSYLEQIFTRLRKENLVSSVRGPGGGYFVTNPLHQVTIQQIIAAMNEDLDARHCRGEGGCHEGQVCLSHHLWHELSTMIEQFLAQVTLQTLIDRYQRSITTEDASASQGVYEIALDQISLLATAQANYLTKEK